MNVVFMGSSEFAVESLRLLAAHHAVRLVLTQPDRPQGRKLRLGETPVKQFSRSRGWEVFQPQSVNAAAAIARLRAVSADVFVVVSFGQILNADVLAIPARGCLNVHASLLPRWRGAAPINWALLNHDEITGVTVIRMNERMDAGDILMSRPVRIREEYDALTLGRELAHVGAAALQDVLAQMAQGGETYTPQDAARVTTAPKLRKQYGRINWSEPAVHIHDQVRGLVPWPSAFTCVRGRYVKVHRTASAAGVAVPGDCAPGTIIDIGKQRGIIVATGAGSLAIGEVQPEGGRRMNAYDFVLGHALEPGDKLE